MIKQVSSIEEAEKALESDKVIFYKHSTRCGVSFESLREIKTFLSENDIDIYLINVIEERDVSNYLEKLSGIRHESPQIIIIENGIPVFTTSHYGISKKILTEQINH